MWHIKGGLFQMRRASKSWRSALQSSFWEDGVHEWETNNVRSRATYADPAEEPQWRASDFMVCTGHEM